MKKMKTMLLHEETYAQEREEIVRPFLEERKTEKYLERELGKKLFVTTYRTDAPRAVAVISHGSTESVRKYEEPVYYFLNQGYDVVLPEHCGHGKSYRLVDDPSLVHVDGYERYVQDLLYVIHDTKKQYPEIPLVLFGHSMGGGIAAQTAAEAPELIDTLVLSSPMIRPLTGNIPWKVTMAITNFMCLLGKSTEYVAGQKPFEDKETFEDSSSLSRGRFEYYYQNVKRKDPIYQTNAASYGWLKAAAGLTRQLLTRSYENLTMPILLTQSGKDAFVSNDAQTELIRKIKKQGNSNVWLLRFPEAKHECYNGYDALVEKYWTQVFRFLDRTLHE